jgi:hypothetical protein
MRIFRISAEVALLQGTIFAAVYTKQYENISFKARRDLRGKLR